MWPEALLHETEFSGVIAWLVEWVMTGGHVGRRGLAGVGVGQGSGVGVGVARSAKDEREVSHRPNVTTGRVDRRQGPVPIWILSVKGRQRIVRRKAAG